MKVELTALAIPKQYSLPLIVALNIAILVVSYFLVFNNQFREKGVLARDLAKAEQERSSLMAIKNNLKKTGAEYARLTADLQEMMRQIPEEKEVPNLFRQISTTAQGARIKIKYFAPKEVQPEDFYAELPFEIKYSGPYHGLGYFFDGIRNMERIVQVTSFSLEAKGTIQKPVLEGSCLAKTYVFQKDGSKAKNDGNKEKKNGLDKK
jgi:type IV pilus assembly protein PilO